MRVPSGAGGRNDLRQAPLSWSGVRRGNKEAPVPDRRAGRRELNVSGIQGGALLKSGCHRVSGRREGMWRTGVPVTRMSTHVCRHGAAERCPSPGQTTTSTYERCHFRIREGSLPGGGIGRWATLLGSLHSLRSAPRLRLMSVHKKISIDIRKYLY